MIPRRSTVKFEYLGEFDMEIKNILGHESGAHVRLIHEKNRGHKSCATVPLRANHHKLNNHQILDLINVI
jgi:hypothetical protein